MSKTEKHKRQLHAGNHPAKAYKGRRLFHTDSEGRYWCGWQLIDLTPRELLRLARSVERDVLMNHPELRE
jgi:hypothetical protein